MAPSGKGLGVAKLAAIAIAAYLLGITVSPYILPIDFVISKIQPSSSPATATQQNGEQKKNSSHDASTVSVEPPTPATANPPTRLPKKQSPHEVSYKNIVDFGSKNDPFYGVNIVVHRNGEPDPCSRQVQEKETDGSLSPPSAALINAADKINHGNKPLDMFDKYDFDAMLTHAMIGGLDDKPILPGRGDTCGPTWSQDPGVTHHVDGFTFLKNKEISPMVKFCDMGVDKTPIQLDHNKYVRVPDIQSQACHFHTREGVRITSLEQLAQLARDAKVPTGECTEDERDADGTCGENAVGEQRRELHLYAVQAARVFIFAPKYVGEIFELPHVKVPNDLPVWIEVISLSPRVFDIFNFFDREESALIVDKALKETSETHRMKRSSTGASGYNVNSQRTSENGFDTHGNQAQAVKRRCMNVLGFDEYIESLTDGLQVLRYNQTTAYVPHLDWIDDVHKQQEHDFDTAHLGSNRFATILLYMSDLEEEDGGETVFTKGWPPNQAEEDRVQFNEALVALRESGDVEGLLKPNSWEEKMVARCRSRLAIRPHSSRAVLFYSQNPDGTPDSESMHGGCPVVSGEKWAANLWVWNAPRGGFPGSPKNQKVVERNRAAGKKPDDGQKKASFQNTEGDENMKNAKLYFQETFWGKLGHGDPILNVNTYEGHEWNVKVDNKTVKTFLIDKKPVQRYII